MLAKRLALLSPLLLLSFPMLTGCTCSPEKEAAPKVQQQEQVSAPKIPPRVDEALLAELRAATSSCKEGSPHIVCTGGKKNALTLEFNRGKRRRVAALPTFSYALRLGDEKLAALSASVLYASFRLGLATGDAEPLPKDLNPEDARTLLDGALALPPQPATQAIPAAVHGMLLTNQGPQLKAALDKDIPIQVKTMALRYMMVYGRLDVFDDIKAAGEQPGTAIVLAAVESPRNMKDWTAEERSAVCPWLTQFMDDERGPVSGNAMAGLSNCDSKVVDDLLARLSQALKDKKFSFIHATTLRNLCATVGDSRSSQASDAQCEKVRSLQEKVATAKDLKPRVRAMTLANLAYIWPDERSFRFAKKLLGDPSPDVKRAAEQIDKRLERRFTK